MPSTPSSKATVHFADIAITRVEHDRALPMKFSRMLDKFNLPERLKGKTVGIKMHFGGSTGYTTIHPVFIRILVQKIKDAGASSVYVMDNNPQDGIARGYTREVLGCEVVSTFGATRKYIHREKIGFLSLDEAAFGGEAVDCDFYINLSHVKGHGTCGFGGALKNIGMGTVLGETRAKLHGLEGGIAYDRSKCTLCEKCAKECKQGAITMKEEKGVDIFFHNCIYCQHCVLICPSKALTVENRTFEDFARGMALTIAAFLRKHKPENMLFINFLTDITIWCDCWGMSTASLVPDIGIVASDDIVAVDTASLDMIKTENLIATGLPKGRELGSGSHLFERIHAKDPYVMIKYLQEYYGGSSAYELVEVV
jgi:hypothetical protein